jgi:DNA-binding GntR family transcriptional regulator
MARTARRPISSKQDEGPLTRSDRVRRRLADQIISGELKPGQQLDEKALAEAFNVSRTPVREALRQLAASELVDWRPHQSAVVATITVPKMVEMFEVMAEVEGFCGRLAARRMTPNERKDLMVRHKKCLPYVKAMDRETYHELNRPFHEAIYAGTHNRYLMDQAKYLYNRLSPYRAYHIHRPGELQRAYAQHQQIVDAIVAGDSDAAHRLLFEHVTLDSDLFADLMANLNVATTASFTPLRKKGRPAAAAATHARARVKGRAQT